MLSCIILAGTIFFTDGRAMVPYDAVNQIALDRNNRLMVRSYGLTWAFDTTEADVDRPVAEIVKTCLDSAQSIDG